MHSELPCRFVAKSKAKESIPRYYLLIAAEGTDGFMTGSSVKLNINSLVLDLNSNIKFKFL